MSEARALAATERCRDLVAHPEKMGLRRREGLEPQDVVVKFNRAAAHTSSAFQVIVTMNLTFDGGKTWSRHSGMPAAGRTEAEALEVFFGWMEDEGALEMFHQAVKAHEADQLDKLAQEALDAKAAESARVAGVARDNNQAWVERKLDTLGRKMGLVKPKVQVS